MSGVRATIFAGLAVAVGCGSAQPAPEPQPAPDRPSPLARFCDRELRELDRYAGPAQYDGEPVPAEGTTRIAQGLARVRPRLRESLGDAPLGGKLLRLLRRAEIAARDGDDRSVLRALEPAWGLASRLGVPECHIGSTGRPS